MKTFAFITLGCKVNQYETQALREAITSVGFQEAPSKAPADLYVINTCTVTSVSDEKSRRQIRKVIRKNPNAKVIVTGCYAETNAGDIKEIDGVDYVFEKGREDKIVDYVKNGFVLDSNSGHFSNGIVGSDRNNLQRNESAFNLKISKFDGHTRAFLKVEDGCDNLCSYCIIPYVRGSIVSRNIDDVISEAEQLVNNGHKEIVLTGIHLGAYGKDFGYKFDILTILSKMQDISGLKRIRLSSIDANEVTDDMIDFIANSEKVCPHFHLPLQSGDDFILKRMNRTYNSLQYLNTVEKIREKIDMPSISTDVMVGFPGEKREHFENTLRVCESAVFNRTHIFPFSPRNGTPAAEMTDRCTPSEIKARKKELESLALETSLKYKATFIGKDISVLVESKRDNKTGKLCGYSDRYIKALFDGDDKLMNNIVNVQVEKVFPQFVLAQQRHT